MDSAFVLTIKVFSNRIKISLGYDLLKKAGGYMYDDILKLDQQLCFRLYQVSRNMTRVYQPFLEKYNLTYPQYIVMLVLFENKVIDFGKLSEIVDLKTGTLTPIVKKLEEFGYVQKIPNAIDKRRVNVILTEKGQLLNKEVIDVPIGVASKLPITEEMYSVLVKELDLLSSMLKNASIISKDNE